MNEPKLNDISFEHFLSEGKLMGSECERCGAIFLPPRSICIKCFSLEMKWKAIKGRGKLIGFTCITVPPLKMQKQGYGRENPYCSGIVELEEKTRMVARIEGVDIQNPESIPLNLPVVAHFVNQGQGENEDTYLAFRPLPS
jgi:uncharacterized OB-fold protein